MSDMTVAIFASIQLIVIPKVVVVQVPLTPGFLHKFVIGGTLGWSALFALPSI